ncbi:MAG TPA: TonB-dependent receptor [Alteraurantiacibacter sp.]
MPGYRKLLCATAIAALALPAAIHAQPEEGERAVPTRPGETLPEGYPGDIPGDMRVWEPVDFDRFAPKNALDMLRNIPGLRIQGGQEERGLGQASGNVLINGERPSSKSASIFDQLSRIPADNVIRIEIVDGATMDIPGLSGRAANVVTSTSGGLQGQFEWNPQLAAEYSTLRWGQGNISISGGNDIEYTFALENDAFHGGTGGPNFVTHGAGTIEERFSHTRSVTNDPKVSTAVRFNNLGSATVNLNAAWQWDRFDNREDEVVVAAAGLPAALEEIRTKRRGHNYEFGGDIAFPLGPGTLKLIGLESYRTSDFSTQSIIDPDNGDPSFGIRFTQHSESGERIGRSEYSWPMAGGDWQISAEAAFNRLDQVSSLFALDPMGDFDEIPFPAGTGGVREDRYEAILSYSTQLAQNLSMQLSLGGESSKISQIGTGALSRSFRRPKGRFSLAWAPHAGFDISFTVERKVGQLDFEDFLANVNLSADNANAANNDLRPEQSWETDLEIAKDLGAWGSMTVNFFDNRITDFITIVPLPGGGEGVGNVGSARIYGVAFNGTLRFDPAGLTGAQLEMEGQFRKSRLDDPTTGEERSFDNSIPRNVEFTFRHDVPRSEWAWGVGLRNTDFNPYYRVTEFGFDYNVKTNLRVFIEHKDIFGLTVQARLNNILEQEAVLQRTVWDGPRDSSPILFAENRRREIGKIVNFTVKGNF